jgi:peroxiredoxin
MNKKVIKYALLSGLVLGLLWLGYGIVHKITAKKAVAARTSQLPIFRFEGLDGKIIASTDFKNKPVWLLYFDSDCEFCLMQLSDIQQHSSQLSHIKIVLVSSENSLALRECKQKYGFGQWPNLTIARDTTHLCTTLLGMTTTPSSLLYGADGRLVKKYNGVVKSEVVMKAFE